MLETVDEVVAGLAAPVNKMKRFNGICNKSIPVNSVVTDECGHGFNSTVAKMSPKLPSHQFPFQFMS